MGAEAALWGGDTIRTPPQVSAMQWDQSQRKATREAQGSGRDEIRIPLSTEGGGEGGRVWDVPISAQTSPQLVRRAGKASPVDIEEVY